MMNAHILDSYMNAQAQYATAGRTVPSAIPIDGWPCAPVISMERSHAVFASNAATGITERSSARRRLTPEQGRAVETIGHAVDYLNDCYYHEGSDDEILDVCGPRLEAVKILVSGQRQILRSAPVAEPFLSRVRRRLFRRRIQPRFAVVIPFTTADSANTSQPPEGYPRQ